MLVLSFLMVVLCAIYVQQLSHRIVPVLPVHIYLRIEVIASADDQTMHWRSMEWQDPEGHVDWAVPVHCSLPARCSLLKLALKLPFKLPVDMLDPRTDPKKGP